MENQIQDQFVSFADSVLAYLPSLFGGIILILLGFLIGWLTKKALVQLSIMMRVDRWIRSSRFDSDFSKADVRYGFYNLIGNIGYAVIFMIFLDNAMLVWKLHILSELLSKGILFLPKIIIALVIFGVGWLLSSWVQISIFKTLVREEISRASLISRFVKSIILIFFSAVSLVELDVAREIIIIAFSTIFVSLGVITVVLIVSNRKNFIKKIEENFKEDKHD